MKKILYSILLLFPLLVSGQPGNKPNTSAGSNLIFHVEPRNTSIKVDKRVWPVFSREDPNNGTQLLNQIEKFHSTTSHPDRSYVSSYRISPDGDQIVYVLGYYNKYVTFTDQPNENNRYYELYFYKNNMKNPKLIGNTGSFQNEIKFPLLVQYWIDNTRVLLESFSEGIEHPLGVAYYDVSNFSLNKIPINEKYASTPIAYELGTKLFYYSLPPNITKWSEMPKDQLLQCSFDLFSGTEKEILSMPKEIKDVILKVNIKSDTVDDQRDRNLFLLTPTSTNGCILSGVSSLSLPWTCNKAMCVERDGPQPCAGYSCANNMGDYDMTVEYSDCSLTPGSNYVGACNNCPTGTCGHKLPAIDFGDGGLWFQTGTPVLASVNGMAQKRYQGPPMGAGNYVVIKSPRSGGGYFYTYYMHLSSVASNIPMNSWVNIYKGNQIGLEGATGDPSYSAHYHFQLKDQDDLQHSFYPVFSEYGGCTPKTGRTYFSRNVPTDGSMQNGFDCNAVTSISCNAVLTGQTNVGNASRYATYGNGYHSWDEFGPEKIYKLVTTQSGTISAVLSNVVYSQGNDLDVFILKNTSCSSLDPLVDTKSTTSGLTATITNAAAGTYFIIVDGYNGSSGTFKITVSAPCSLPNLTDNGSTRTSSGRNITVTSKVINNGGANAGTFKTRYWLSPDIYFGNDYVLGTVTYSSGLPAGSTSTSMNTWTAPTNVLGGTYYVLFTIDYAVSVTESNETDNSFYFTTPVNLPPPPIAAAASNRQADQEEASITEEITEPSNLDFGDIAIPIHQDESLINLKAEVQTFCDVTTNGFDIVSTPVDPESRYMVYNTLGRVVCSGKANDDTINCSVSAPGLYFFSIFDRNGNKCVQKVFIE